QGHGGNHEQESGAKADTRGSGGGRLAEIGQAELQEHEQRSEHEEVGEATMLRCLHVNGERGGSEENELDGGRKAHARAAGVTAAGEEPTDAKVDAEPVLYGGRGAGYGNGAPQHTAC